MKRLFIKIVILYLMLCCGTTVAQRKLSLSKAIDIGLSNNFDIVIAVLEENLAVKNNKFGVPERYPQINFSLRQRNRLNADSSPTSFVDGVYSQNDISAGIDLDWVLFDGFQVSINKRQLEQLEEQSRGQARLVVENTIEAIILAYYKAAIEQEKLDVLKEARFFSHEKHQKAKTEYRFGDISQYDLNNFENALLADSINYYAQEIVLNQSLIRLNFLMGGTRDKQYALTDKLEMDYVGKKYNITQLERQLHNSNQDIKNQYINLQLQENRLRLLKAQRMPRVALNTGSSEELGTSKFTGDTRENGGVFDFYVNFSASYTLYDGGKLKQQLEEAKIKELVVNQQIEKIKSEVQEKIRTRYDKYNRQSDVLRLRRRLIDNLTKNTEIALNRVEGGYSPFIEYRDLQVELLEAKLDLLETVFDLKVAETEITRLVGGILKEKR